MRALLIEDDDVARSALRQLLESAGFVVDEAVDLAAARLRLIDGPPQLLLCDLYLPDGSSLDLVESYAEDGEVDVVLITGHASVDSAVRALRCGVTDYLTKPTDVRYLKRVLKHLALKYRGHARSTRLRRGLARDGRFGAMVGRSPLMLEVYDLIQRVAPTRANVMLLGESGTGKEVVARTIHELSGRPLDRFVALNCGAVTDNLIESELFGHEKGAFTGAGERQRGVFERADGGTLLLDEITEMRPELQVRLLRALENHTVTRVGGQEEIPVDVRILAASNRDPAEAVAEGVLRQDLWYRLSVFPIHLPPLRERPGDVPLLVESFLADLAEREGLRPRLADGVLDELAKNPWPGNVRELKNAIERAVILADETIAADMVTTPERIARHDFEPPVGLSIATVERSLIEATLEWLDGDKTRAAEVLGISVRTLYNRLTSYEEGGKAS